MRHWTRVTSPEIPIKTLCTLSLVCLMVGVGWSCTATEEVTAVGQDPPAAQRDEDIAFDPAAGGPTDLGLRDPILVGSIDMHAHLDPDMSGGGQVARAMDTIDMARAAAAIGIRGFVQKTHMDVSSATAAHFAREAVPEVEVFGRFVLNLPVGGINPAAVMQFISIEGGWGRIVEMPTRDARAPETEGRPWVLPWTADFPSMTTFVPVSRNGILLPEVQSLIALLAEVKTVGSDGRVVLATGHATPADHMLLAREARRQGVQVMLTHPSAAVTLAMKQEVAELGGFIEVLADFNQWGENFSEKADYAAETIRGVGAESIVMGSDCGQMNNPLPSDCLVLAARALRARGITERELNLMYKENPARLLGLAPPSGSATN
jgi:hypothetical protein